MRILIVAATLLLAACSPAQEKAEEPAASSENLPAPTPDDVSIRITADQNGQTVEVPVNQRFAIELVGVPTAGYVWQVASMPANITRAGEPVTGNMLAEQNEPGYAGGNHWEVTMFAATAAGTGDIVMEQRRPWESDEPATETFRVTIVAR